MPKYLDLIYRVKDSASEALKRARASQDDAGKSADSLRSRLKSLKAQYTELKSALQLVGIGFNLLKSIVIGSTGFTPAQRDSFYTVLRTFKE